MLVIISNLLRLFYMKKIFSTTLSLLLIYSFAISPVYAAEKKHSNLSLGDLVLPSDLPDVRKEGGSIYYSMHAKGKVLVPVNVWGEVNKSGLHYMPGDTEIIKALSLAGGPRSTAKLSNVRLTRVEENKIKEYVYDLSDGGDAKAFQRKIEAGDTIFVERNYFYENRAYYTSMIGVAATILTSILLYREIQKN